MEGELQGLAEPVSEQTRPEVLPVREQLRTPPAETEASTALIRDAKVTVGAVALDGTTDAPAVAVDVIVLELTVGGVVPDEVAIGKSGAKKFTKKNKR